MTTHFFTEELDTNLSSVFHRILWDAEDRVLYLVFNNLTTASRKFEDWYDDPDVSVEEDYHGSWGRYWNLELKGDTPGPVVESGDAFEQREEAPKPDPEQDDVADENNNYVSLSVYGLSDADALVVTAYLATVTASLHEARTGIQTSISRGGSFGEGSE